MDVKPGYKLTEVGVIPEDWEIRAVSEKGRVTTGKALAVDARGKPRWYLRTKNVMDGHIVLDDVLSMPMTDEQFALFELRSGDVLLNEGQSLELVGRCAMYRGELGEPCAIQNQLIRFRAYDKVSPHFATHLFRHCQQSGVFAKIALQTTSIAHLGGVRFARLNLAWPETRIEQDAIAEVLSDADSLASALSHLIAKRRDIKQAAMQQLLTGQTRLPGFHGEWEVNRLGSLGFTYGGLTGKSKKDFDTGSALYVTFMQVMSDVVIESGSFGRVHVQTGESQNQVLKGDLIFNGSSETPEEVAMCALVSVDVSELYLNSFCFGFRLHGEEAADSKFIAYLIRSAIGREIMASLAQGSTRYNLSKTALLQAELLLPALDEQRAIAAVLSDMDAELSALEARREKTLALKQAMMQELLTGRTRLV